jgi:hypothetical protein
MNPTMQRILSDAEFEWTKWTGDKMTDKHYSAANRLYKAIEDLEKRAEAAPKPVEFTPEQEATGIISLIELYGSYCRADFPMMEETLALLKSKVKCLAMRATIPSPSQAGAPSPIIEEALERLYHERARIAGLLSQP